MSVGRVSVAAALLCPLGAAAAQDNRFRFELTPFAGHRVGGELEHDVEGEIGLDDSATHGIILNITEDADTQWEILFSRQATVLETRSTSDRDRVPNLDVEYLHFGGTYQSDGIDNRFFLAGTLGVSRFDPDPTGFGSETYLSASLGGGVQLRSTSRVGIRLEGRVFTTFVDSDKQLFCSSGGATNLCSIRLEGDTFTQWEIRAGLVFRFLPYQ